MQNNIPIVKFGPGLEMLTDRIKQIPTKLQKSYITELKNKFKIFYDDSIIMYSALVAVNLLSVKQIGLDNYAYYFSKDNQNAFYKDIEDIRKLAKGWPENYFTVKIGLHFLHAAVKYSNTKSIDNSRYIRLAKDYDNFIDEQETMNDLKK